jgi:ubiquitin carboxyl-terminal hydrolase L5
MEIAYQKFVFCNAPESHFNDCHLIMYSHEPKYHHASCIIHHASCRVVACTRPAHGLIFLFQWQQSEQKDNRPTLTEEQSQDIFFAKQVVHNACATQAIISVLMNRKGLDLGDDLNNFKEFAAFLPPVERGESIGSMDSIRIAHNSFARQEPFNFDPEKPSKTSTEEVYHFVAFVPVNGKLYELDGLKDGPIELGECDEETWLEKARVAIQARMQMFQQSAALNYNLLALCSNKQNKLEKEIKVIQTKISALQSGPSSNSSADMSDSSNGDAEFQSLSAQLQNLKDQLEDQIRLRQGWTKENIRRRHNYVPLIFALCTALAENGKLMPLMQQAEEITKRKREAEAKRTKAATAGSTASQQ